MFLDIPRFPLIEASDETKSFELRETSLITIRPEPRKASSPTPKVPLPTMFLPILRLPFIDVSYETKSFELRETSLVTKSLLFK